MLRKKVISNTAAQLFGRATTSVLGFFTTYFIIRLSGTELYGDMTKIVAILAINYTALDFGINAHVVRSLSNKSRQAQQALLTNLFFLRLLFSFLLIFLSAIVVFLLPGSPTHGYTPLIKQVYLVSAISILFQGIHLSANSIFQHRFEYYKSAVASITGSIAWIVFTVLALIISPTLLSVLLAFTAGSFINALISFFYLRPWLITRFNLSSSLALFRQSIPLGIVLLLSIIANKTDAVVLGIFRSSSEVGEYGFAYKIFDFALVIPVFTMNAVYPALLSSQASLEKVKRIIKRTSLTLLALSFIFLISLYLAAPLIVYVRPDMTTAITSLRLLSFSLPFFYLSAPLMWLLITYRKEKLLAPLYLLASIINLAGNLLAVPYFGATASAILTSVTEAVILIGLYYLARKAKYV